jgi:hypothetical protein
MLDKNIFLRENTIMKIRHKIALSLSPLFEALFEDSAFAQKAKSTVIKQ